jgi:hypothetical protein
VKLRQTATLEQVADAFTSYRGEPQRLGLPSAPDPAIILHTAPDRPQPRLDRLTGKGMATSIGSATDVRALVSQLVDLERSAGPIAMYQTERNALSLRSATLTDLRSALSALEREATAVAQPGSLSPFASKMVTSSLPSVVTATASASAAGGTHTLVVTQLAKRSTLVSNQLAHEGADLVDALARHPGIGLVCGVEKGRPVIVTPRGTAGATVDSELETIPSGDQILMMRDPFGFCIQFVCRKEPMVRRWE